MKKTIALIAAAILVLSLAGCGANQEEPAKEQQDAQTAQTEEKKEEPAEEPEAPISGVPNPATTYDSLEALNEACGTSIEGPGVMGKTDEAFVSIKTADYTLAEYDFTVGGNAYSLRVAPTTEDISGIYGENGSAFEGSDESEEVVECGGSLLYRWFNIEGQYVLSVKADGLDKETFKGIAEEIKSVNSPSNGANFDVNYSTLTGEYADKVSQRAMATLTGLEDAVQIEVRWGDSADVTYVWTMTASFGEDGLLYYSDCRSAKQTTAADGTTSEEELSKDGEGFFALGENGDLEWTGAADENCKECVFEKMPE